MQHRGSLVNPVRFEAECFSTDEFSKSFKILPSVRKRVCENFREQLAPQGGDGFVVVVRNELPEIHQVERGTCVSIHLAFQLAAALKHELRKLEE